MSLAFRVRTKGDRDGAGGVAHERALDFSVEDARVFARLVLRAADVADATDAAVPATERNSCALVASLQESGEP